ncbi:hypothetical protein BCAR13_410029 [Paraburkholderia caribensis]|nr:hypothetical protein BCAR13_410029 [Paraburkholderia caribensis]
MVDVTTTEINVKTIPCVRIGLICSCPYARNRPPDQICLSRFDKSNLFVSDEVVFVRHHTLVDAICEVICSDGASY